jgi:hypothetical protein
MDKKKIGNALVILTSVGNRAVKSAGRKAISKNRTQMGAPNVKSASGRSYHSYGAERDAADKITKRATEVRKKAKTLKYKPASTSASVTPAKKKGSALKTTAKVAGVIIGTAAGATGSAEYLKKKNAEAKANANKVKVNANKVQQNVSKVNANTLKNYKNEEKVAENTRKVAENKSKVQSNAVKVYSNAEKVNAEKARTATTNAQKVAANKAKIEANKKKVAANAAKYK